MPLVTKLSDTSYKVKITDSDMSAAFPENFTFIPVNTDNTSSGKVISGSVLVEFTPEAADTIRDKVSRILSLGMDLGDPIAENKFLHALFSSPVPCAGMYGGAAPSLTPDDDIGISEALNSLSVSHEFNIGSIQIGVGDTYRLKFIPDARGFDISLENTNVEDSLLEDHPFVLTLPFVIASSLENPAVSSGAAGKSAAGSVDDARVMFYEKDYEIMIGEVLTRAFALSGIRDRGMLIDAYNDLFSLSMWRGGSGVDVVDPGMRPSSSHLCGVDPAGRSIQYLPLEGLIGSEQIAGVNLMFSGSAKVKFLVGNIRYPFNPIFGIRKVLFDVCKDDIGWTDVGPLAEQYIGGDGVEGVNVIHSWTGRTSTNVKKESLASIGQSKLGG